MKYYAIIVAGGSGSRMDTDIPKQFLLLHGLPVLMHTINAFGQSTFKPEIIVVLNESYHSFWKELCAKYSFDLSHHVIAGGDQRFDSVKNGLQFINSDSIIAIHDAARPVITRELIDRCFKIAEITGTAIPVISSRDSLRKKEKKGTSAINRADILIVQTPQVFKSAILHEAYQQAFCPEFTDDASVVEKIGVEINTVEGDFRNIKITYKEDLEVAAVFKRTQVDY